MQDLGTTIKQIRESKNLSQAQIGGHNLSRSYISGIEREKFHPSPEALNEIAQNLQEPLARFIPYFLQSHPTPRAIVRLANIFFDQNEFQLTEELIDHALEDPRSSKDYTTQTMALNTLARIANIQNKYTQAHQYFQQALHLALNNNLPEEIAQAEIGIATLYGQQGQHITALKHLQAAQNHLFTLQNRPATLMLRNASYMGNILYSLGWHTVAYEHYKHSSYLLAQTEDLHTILSFLMGYALSAHQVRHLDEAFSANAKALYYAYRLKEYELMADIYSNVGILLRETDNKRAITYLKKSLNLRTEDTPKWKKGYTQNELAQSYLRNRQFKEAHCYAKKALTNLDDTNPDEKAQSYEIIGDTFKKQNLHTEALNSYLQAKTLYSDTLKHSKVTGKIAEIYCKTGDINKGLTLYKEALEQID